MLKSHAETFDRLFGQICTNAASNIGSMVSLDFGGGAGEADMGLLIWFGNWTLTDRGAPLASSNSERTAIVYAIAGLVGSTVERFGVHEETGAARIWFDDRKRLTIRPSTIDPSEPWWIVYRRGDAVVEVGPGPSFSTPQG